MVDFLIPIEIGLLFGLPVVGLLWFVLRRKKGVGKDYYKVGIIDEARKLNWTKYPKDKIKDVGKWAIMEIKDKDYFILKEAILSNAGQPTLILSYNDPIPFSFRRLKPSLTDEALGKPGEDILGMSATELQQVVDSKVVSDALTATFFDNKTMILIIGILGCAVLSIVSLYFSYSASAASNTANDTLKALIRALFPNTTAP